MEQIEQTDRTANERVQTKIPEVCEFPTRKLLLEIVTDTITNINTNKTLPDKNCSKCP
jgi:hypothetical protein